MIIEYLKDGKKMLTNKITYTSNTSSNVFDFSSNSSVVPNTLFELMKTNILVVDTKVCNTIIQHSINSAKDEK